MKYKVFPSNPYPLGVRKEGKKIYASMVSGDSDCGIILYKSKAEEDEESFLKIPFPKEQHIGQVYSMKIEGVPGGYNEYRLYRNEEILVDEYGTCYKGYPFGNAMEPTQMMGVLGGKAFDWEEEKKPVIAFSESVFYGLHVRGFTMHGSSKCRSKGTFAGVKEKLDYLQDLGITSIILMPVYEFIENELMNAHREKKTVINYWGYKPAYYYAPKASYAAGKDPCTEFKQLVKACHNRGMELLMQFYFAREISETEMVRILEHWVIEYHVDGFQLLTDRENIAEILKSPVLAESKLIFRDFREDGTCEKQGAKGNKRLCIYRNDTMRDYRRFLKGDDFMVDAVKYHLGKNDAHKAFMNSIADYHGFRLADLVSCNYKHNKANREDNMDGTDDNYSWNCGEEGVTDNPRILALRIQQMKNALSLIFMSQGTPYIFMGDEMGSTQYGNNNPYNQDNIISWLDWRGLEENKEIYEFIKALIAYRREHPFLHTERVLDGRDYLGYGYPNISFHGIEAYHVHGGENCRELGVLLCGEGKDKSCKLVYAAFNMHWLHRKLALPRLKNGAEWQIAMKTTGEEVDLGDGTISHVEVPPRTVVILEAQISKPGEADDKQITPF